MTQINENTCDVQHTKELMSDLYKNVTMAQNSTKTLLDYVKQKDIKHRLHNQIKQYDSYVEQLDGLSQSLNFEPSPASQFAQTMAKMGIKSKMITDKSQTHVAKIMMQGTLNGVIDLYRLVRKYTDANPQVTTLLKEVLHFEESCLEHMKGWL